MNSDSLTTILCIVALFGLVFGMILMAYEDGVEFARWKKLRCKFGWHRIKKYKVAKYYCQFCKKPRKHPKLRAISGGKKSSSDIYKF